MAMATSISRGKRFEYEVEEYIRSVVNKFPSRSSIVCQAQTHLNDGRTKIIDFTLHYRTSASSHEIAIECQDRERWDSEIVDKILAIRLNSYHNRFWFVFRDDSFLSVEAIALLDSHGIMHFSLEQLRNHLGAIENELAAAELLQEKHKVKYEAPSDSAMTVTRPKSDLDMTARLLPKIRYPF